MSNGPTFVSLHCWTNNVRQFDPSLTIIWLYTDNSCLRKLECEWQIHLGYAGDLRLQLHGAIYRPDSFVMTLRYCTNLKAIRYE